MFDREQKNDAFESYESYMEYLFACVNEGISRCLERLKEVYATGRGITKMSSIRIWRSPTTPAGRN